jgi:hypothetical protein
MADELRWIDRQVQEPDPTATPYILVVVAEGFDWTTLIGRIVSCRYDYDTWLDMVDGNTMNFRWWLPVSALPAVPEA